MALTGTRKRFSFGPKRLSVALLLILLVSVTLAWSAAAPRPEEQTGATGAAAPAPESAQQIREIIAKGTRHYEKAEFQEALTAYEAAAKLDPDGVDLKQLLSDTQKNLEFQQTLRATAPADRAELDKALEARYAKAGSSFEAQKLDEARREFYQIWLLGGEYKQTRQYLSAIGQINAKKLTIEQARANLARQASATVQVASAQADAPVAPEAAQALITPPAAEAPKPAEKKEDAKKEEAKPAQEAPKPVEKKDEAKPAEATAEPAKDLTPKPLAPAQETEKKETPKPAEKKQEAQPAPTPAPEPEIVDADKKDEAAKAAAAVVVPKTTGAEQRAVQAVEDALKLADAGKFDDALSMLEKAAVVSENPKILEARKTVEAKRNEAQGARVKAEQEKIEIFLDSADDALDEKDFETARKNYEMALELDASNAAAQRGLKKVADQKAKAEKAEADERERVQEISAAEQQKQVRIQMERELMNLFKQANEAEFRKDYFSALEAYELVLQNDPANLQAKNGLNRMQGAVKAQLAAIAAPAKTDENPNLAPPEMSRPVQKNLIQADAFYREKTGEGVAKARERWQEVLKLDASNLIAQTYLDQTADEYELYLAEQKKKEEGKKREVAGIRKINTPVTIDTTDPNVEPPLLPDFLLNLSYSTGINFNVTAGQENPVHCKFVDTPLNEVLDAVLIPMGLRWERVQGDVVQVNSDMKSKVFKLTSDEARKVQILIADGTLNNILREGKEPAKGAQLDLDEREQVLMMVDSQTNIDKMAAFLKEMRSDESVLMSTRIYKVDPERADRVKALVDALILAESAKAGDKQLDLDRMVILDNSKENLIIKDTIPNLEKAEELLANVGEYIGKSEDEDLTVQTFEIMKNGVALNPESNVDHQFYEQVYEQIETLLYTEIGLEASRELGRRMWPERDKLAEVTDFKIVVSDTKKRLRDVSDFLAITKAVTSQDEAFEIIYLKFQKTSDMQALLDTVYGIDSGGAAAGSESAQGNERRFTLNNPEREVTFRDCSIRLIRVEGSNSNSNSGGSSSTRSDRRIELNVRTALRTDTQQVNIEEYQSETVDNYEIICEEIKIGGGKAGGRARIRVRYTPPEQMGLMGGTGMMPGAMGLNQIGVMGQPGVLGQTGLLGQTAQSDRDTEDLMQEMGFEYNQFGNLNAFIVRYTDPSALAKLKQFIVELDKPTPQVSLQTKFVTVNQEKAKEFSMNWNLTDHNSPTVLSPTTDEDGNVVTTAAGLATDYLDIISNDYTVFSGGSPKSFLGKTLEWNLRLLEVEGIVTYVNGPQVTVMDGQTADFEIEGLDYQFDDDEDLSMDTIDQLLGNSSANADEDSSETTETSSDSVGFGWDTQVMLSVEPEITSPESILLQIDVEIKDNSEAGIGVGLWNYGDEAGYARGNNIGIPNRRKTLQTYARVKDGGTTVLGGWTAEVAEDLESGTPGFRDIPWIGKLFFTHSVHTRIRTNLLIFLSANLVD